MPTFAYRAATKSGKRCRGVVTADTARQARDRLRADGMIVEWITAHGDPAATAKNSASGLLRRLTAFRPQHRAALTTLVRELATLLQAGIPLLDSLDSLVMQSRGRLHDALLSVRDRVSAGESLADALAQETSIFDEMTISLVRVGEHAGNLDDVFEQLADFRERSSELRDRVVSALLYPTIVFLISVGVTIFLMTVVVPMLLTNLVDMGQPLPWPTRILKALSDLLLEHGWWCGLLFLACIGGVAASFASAAGKRRGARLLHRLPVIGTLAQRQSISRMALVLSSLLRSGVELVDALRIAENASGSVLVGDALAELTKDLEAGRPMRESIAKHRVFPPALAQVFALGQQSGQLAKMLDRIGRDYDRQAAVIAGRLTSIVEPVLIVGLGIVVGFIMLATVLPILEAGNVLSN